MMNKSVFASAAWTELQLHMKVASKAPITPWLAAVLNWLRFAPVYVYIQLLRAAREGCGRLSVDVKLKGKKNVLFMQILEIVQKGTTGDFIVHITRISTKVISKRNVLYLVCSLAKQADFQITGVPFQIVQVINNISKQYLSDFTFTTMD